MSNEILFFPVSTQKILSQTQALSQDWQVCIGTPSKSRDLFES